jgi:hypothetical protein
LDGFSTGEVIEISLEIVNTDVGRQFYALDDYIPGGTMFLRDSPSYSGSMDTDDITVEESGGQIHFFIPNLDSGSLYIKYRVQIEKIKYSSIEGCRLWGMYDDFEIQTDLQVLMRIPRLFDFKNNLYKDHFVPTGSAVIAEQISSHKAPSVEFTIQIEDNSPIEKIKILYFDGTTWRARSYYVTESLEQYKLLLDNLPDGDYQLKYVIEVWDIYGNIGTLEKDSLPILSVNIPYVQIGILIGLSMGIAIVATKLVSKQWHKQSSPEISFLETKE